MLRTIRSRSPQSRRAIPSSIDPRLRSLLRSMLIFQEGALEPHAGISNAGLHRRTRTTRVSPFETVLAPTRPSANPQFTSFVGAAGQILLPTDFELLPSQFVGTGWTNPEDAFDGDEDTFAQGNSGSFEVWGFQPMLTGPYVAKVKMVSSAPTVPSGATVYGEYSVDSGQNWTEIYARTGLFVKTVDKVPINSLPTTTAKIQARQRLVGGSVSNSVKNGATLANANYAPGSLNWTGPANAQTSNDSYATAALAAEEVTNYLKVTNLSFGVTGVVQGIRVRVERKASAATWIVDAAVRLVKGDVVVGEDKATSAGWPTSDAYVSYGDDSDLWAESWNISDINASDFGIVIAARNEDVSTARTASIDHIEITVWYSGNVPTGRLHEATVVLSLK